MAKSYRYIPTICRHYNNDNCLREDCTHPHVCFKFFDPTSFCREGQACKFNHNILDKQVGNCLRRAGFHIDVKPGELRHTYVEALKTLTKETKSKKELPLLCPMSQVVDDIQRQTSLLGVTRAPPVCLNFNHGVCHNKSCDLLHICKDYLEGNCKNSFKSCPLKHDVFQPRVKELLRSAGLNVDQQPKLLIEEYRRVLQRGVQPGPARMRTPRGRPPRGTECTPIQQKQKIKSLSVVDLRREGLVKNYERQQPTETRSATGSESGESSEFEEDEVKAQPIHTPKKGQRPKRKKNTKSTDKAAARDQSQTKPEVIAGGKGALDISIKPGLSKPRMSMIEDADICLNFLSDGCPHEHCLDHHQVLPYLWQYKVLQQGWQWRELSKDNVQLLEQSYCIVDTTTCSIILEGQMFTVDFEKMVACTGDISIPIRRLSTLSFVTVSDEQVFATKWIWYWDSDDGWIECGRKTKEAPPQDTQRQLEEAYQSDATGHTTINVNRFSYKVEFTDMRQTNSTSGTERRLRRRPVFLSPDEIKKLKSVQLLRAPSQAKRSPSELPLPVGWSPMSDRDEVVLQDVPLASTDLQGITVRFALTMPRARLILVKRIQNPTLWFTMSMKKSKMERDCGKGNVNEMNLFHGTCPDAVNPICEQNFDWRLYGSSAGARYGKGVYFAMHADKANQYVTPDKDGLRFMFSARVLLGKFTKGKKTMRRPPPLDSDTPSKLYDSCTDDPTQPAIFVLFDKDQYYPEFIICYKE